MDRESGGVSCEGHSGSLVKSDTLGYVEGSVGWQDGVLGEGPVGSAHDVEAGDAVALGEAGDAGADLVDEAGGVVAGVGSDVEPEWEFPIFGVCAYTGKLVSWRNMWVN